VTDVSIVIPTWNGLDVLVPCLESIEREVVSRGGAGRIEAETLVVDNGSSDGTSEVVRQRFPWAQVIALAENRGFAGGSNAGLQRARGRHLLLLNNDTVLLPGAIESCVAFLDAHPDVGVVGGQLLHPDGSRQNSVHNLPGLATELLPKPLLETLLPGRFPSKRRQHAGAIDVEAVLGAFLMVRREVVEQVGGLSEEYFFFLEETEWCGRIARAGWRVVHLPEARVVHVLGATTKKRMPAETRIEYHRSLYRYFRRERGPLQAALVVGLRFLKSLLYVALGALPAIFSARARERLRRDASVLGWHLRGCPADAGLARAVGGAWRAPVPSRSRRGAPG
jgi:GT2 family glycosyltransferase